MQRYLDALKSAGLIRITDGDGGTDQRKIFAGINPLSDPHDKNDTGGDKKDTAPMTELSPSNNVIIKKDDQDPPISPKEKPAKGPLPADLLSRVEAYAGSDLELRDALIGFAEVRQKQRHPISTTRTLTLLLSRLNELSGGSRKTKLAIIDKATVSGWRSFYPPDGDEPALPPGRTVESPPGVAQW